MRPLTMLILVLFYSTFFDSCQLEKEATVIEKEHETDLGLSKREIEKLRIDKERTEREKRERDILENFEKRNRDKKNFELKNSMIQQHNRHKRNIENQNIQEVSQIKMAPTNESIEHIPSAEETPIEKNKINLSALAQESYVHSEEKIREERNKTHKKLKTLIEQKQSEIERLREEFDFVEEKLESLSLVDINSNKEISSIKQIVEERQNELDIYETAIDASFIEIESANKINQILDDKFERLVHQVELISQEIRERGRVYNDIHRDVKEKRVFLNQLSTESTILRIHDSEELRFEIEKSELGKQALIEHKRIFEGDKDKAQDDYLNLLHNAKLSETKLQDLISHEKSRIRYLNSKLINPIDIEKTSVGLMQRYFMTLTDTYCRAKNITLNQHALFKEATDKNIHWKEYESFILDQLKNNHPIK